MVNNQNAEHFKPRHDAEIYSKFLLLHRREGIFNLENPEMYSRQYGVPRPAAFQELEVRTLHRAGIDLLICVDC